MRTRTENQNQVNFWPFALRQVSVLTEFTLGHLRNDLTDVRPQSNSPPDNVFRLGLMSLNVPDNTTAGSTHELSQSRYNPESLYSPYPFQFQPGNKENSNEILSRPTPPGCQWLGISGMGCVVSTY